MTELFNNFSTEIVFLHILSAIIWVGGMIVIRFGIHYSMMEVDDPKIKLGRTLENLRRFFNMVIPSIIVLLLTAIIMIIALGFKGTELYNIVIIKEIIWVIMVLVFIMIYIKRDKAQKLFDSGDLAGAKVMLAPLPTWMIPLNIIFGLIALYFGIALRGL
jgi:uncharacterized membrane protein